MLSSFRPDLVLYDAGVDPHEDDALGRLALSDEGLRRRELLVGAAWVGFGGVRAGGCMLALSDEGLRQQELLVGVVRDLGGECCRVRRGVQWVCWR